jgi:DNA-binding transcriptional LysR family regulator
MADSDLNLLTALDALLAEGSVVGAARRLRLSSSAMSRTLARLREATGDPLLVRAGPLLCLQRLDAGQLDCALLPMPIDASRYFVHQIAQAPLVVCMRSDDPLADRAQLDVHEVAPRLSVFRDPELHPAAHSRLVEMFTEVGISIHIACAARTPSEIQWMVKERYGLALIDQLFPLEPGLITRPVAGLNWTADTAFVHARHAGHVALPFIERFFQESAPNSRSPRHSVKPVPPEQLPLLA